MKRANTRRQRRCGCENPGVFCSGVPGILACVSQGRLVPETSVQRCDLCRRYPSDKAALDRLRELGMVCEETPAWPTAYTVHCYVTVCVKLTGVIAVSPREAARSVQQQFRWEDHGRDVEFVDELHEMLVDVEGDADFSRSVAFRADLEPVRKDS